MSFEEEFDSIIKQKAEQADFPFDGKNWDKAAAMLDGQKAVTGLPVWKKMIVPAVLGIAAITALVVMLPIEGNKQTAVNTAQNTASINNKTADNSLPTTVTASEKAEVNTAKILSPANTQKKSDKATITENTVPAAQNAAPASAQKEVKQAPKQAATGDASNQETVRTPKPTSSTPKVIHAISTDPVANIDNVSVPPSENIDLRVVDNVINNKDSEPERPVDPPVAAKSNETEVSPVVQNAIAEVSSVSPTDATALNESAETKETLRNVWLPAKSLSLEMPQDNLSVDTKIELLPRYLQDDYVKKAAKYYISVVGGLHYAFGWETAAGKDGKGNNYFGGLEFGKYINANLSFGAGLQYFSFTNIYQPYFASIGKGYGFGYTQSYSSVTTDRLNYLSIPLHINYTTADGFMIGAGFTTNYLLSLHNRIDTYGISDGIKGATTSEGNTNLYEGTKVLGMMANVRVGYTVFNRMSVFADIQYGLNDLFDAQTKKQTDERLTGLRFGLNYILIKK